MLLESFCYITAYADVTFTIFYTFQYVEIIVHISVLPLACPRLRLVRGQGLHPKICISRNKHSPILHENGFFSRLCSPVNDTPKERKETPQPKFRLRRGNKRETRPRLPYAFFELFGKNGVSESQREDIPFGLSVFQALLFYIASAQSQLIMHPITELEQ